MPQGNWNSLAWRHRQLYRIHSPDEGWFLTVRQWLKANEAAEEMQPGHNGAILQQLIDLGYADVDTGNFTSTRLILALRGVPQPEPVTRGAPINTTTKRKQT